MEKEFIPYEQALVLKELGFDEPCFGYYTGDKKHLLIRPNMGRRNEDLNDIVCTAPLYQQAFRFFREKYGIMYRITSYAFGYQIHLDNTPEPKFWNTDRRFDSDVDYEIYEEAELDCLKKLIEIVKEK